MSKLEISFDQPDVPDDTPVIAEILNKDMERVQHITLLLGRSTKVELDPGQYLLRARLPSGELVRKSISVAEDGLRIGIEGKGSSHERLARQHFLGQLPATPALLPADLESTTWLRLWSRKGEQGWQPEKWPGERPSGDGQGVVASLQLSTEKIWAIQIGGETVPQRFVLLPASREIHLLLRATARNTRLNGGVALRVATSDGELEALLRYVTSGAVESAAVLGKEVVEKAPKSASDVLRDPNRSAVGLYYLLTHGINLIASWAHRFAESCSWLPDALIIYATQLLMESESDQRSRATAFLLRATNRGLPTYTQGVRYLYDQLLALRSEAPPNSRSDIERALERLGQYSAAIDWTELRTTFFGKTPDAPSPELEFGQSDPRYAIYPRLRDYKEGVGVTAPMPSRSETTLIKQTRRGVQAAAAQLSSLYSREIRGFLRARARNSFDADDIAQETWITVTNKIEQFDPSRGDFGAFVKYWANITALRWYHDRGRMSQVTRLFSELTSQASGAQDVPDIEEIIRSQEPTPEEAIAASEQYNNLIRVTFSTASPPHQLLAFAYCKLLEWRPRDLVEQLSDTPLRQLAGLFEEAYERQVPYAGQALRGAILKLRQSLSRPIEPASDPASIASGSKILDKAAADTKFRDYYGILPEQNVSHWVYAVRRRALATLKDEGIVGAET